MNKQPQAIIGAGLAGLIAGHAWPQLPILESSDAPANLHKAVLRFRSDAVSRLTGIPFRKVKVRKGLWFGGAFREPTIQTANMYAQKVTGRVVGERSVWNLDPADRFIAPDNFYAQLIVATRDRVRWGAPYNFADKAHDSVINTAPLPVVLDSLADSAIDKTGLAFLRAPIKVRRYEVPGADVFQTVYFPSPATAMYRASITGSLLIVESVVDTRYNDDPYEDGEAVRAAFGLNEWPRLIEESQQRYGKIVALRDEARNALLWKLTSDHGIYSLGRFATWRNILLDDVVSDIDVIKRLSRAAPHQLALHAAR